MEFLRSFSLVFLLLTANNAIVSTTETTTTSSEEEVVLSSPEECARPCVAGEAPKTCYYYFTLENYQVLSGACQVCIPLPNNTFTGECQCVTADGVERSMMTVNRMIPGPSIEVCKGDKVVVDVVNNIEGNEVTIHWHGLWQKGTPYMDGVPMVTQCPIHQANEFRYQFTAGNAGTHFWHSHVGLQKINGICGPLIVREPKSEDVHGDRYDVDDHFTVLFTTDWMHELGEQKYPGRIQSDVSQGPTSLLINGKGRYYNSDNGHTTTAPLEVFTVEKGKKYRFRYINAFATVCPSQLNIEGHRMTVIATDGVAVEPVVVDSIISFSGERYDFIIEADQEVEAYWIQLRSLGECGIDEVQQLAILRYENGPDYPALATPEYKTGLPLGTVLNPLDAKCNESEDEVCISQLKNAGTIDEGIYTEKPDLIITLNYTLDIYNSSSFYQPRTFKTGIIGGAGGVMSILPINGNRYVAASSTLISQYNDNDASQYCNDTNKPDSCDSDDESCDCTHMYHIPLNAIVEVVLIDNSGATNLSHPYHMHGYAPNVIAMGRSDDSCTTVSELKEVMKLAKEKALNITDSKPPGKDTIPVPNNGWVILRFRADNPGFWFFHCHFLYHTAVGMDIVLHVGELEDLPPIPEGFPKCGNFKPNITCA